MRKFEVGDKKQTVAQIMSWLTFALETIENERSNDSIAAELYASQVILCLKKKELPTVAVHNDVVALNALVEFISGKDDFVDASLIGSVKDFMNAIALLKKENKMIVESGYNTLRVQVEGNQRRYFCVLLTAEHCSQLKTKNVVVLSRPRAKVKGTKPKRVVKKEEKSNDKSDSDGAPQTEKVNRVSSVLFAKDGSGQRNDVDNTQK